MEFWSHGVTNMYPLRWREHKRKRSDTLMASFLHYNWSIRSFGTLSESFLLYSPNEIIAPLYVIINMIGGVVDYLTTKLGGSNGKDPTFIKYLEKL